MVDTILTPGNDTFTGTGSGDTIQGIGGNDSLLGAGGDDSLLGGADNDTLLGGNGTDSLFGGEGDDYLDGQGGNNAGLELLDGGNGNDYLIAGPFTRLLAGGDGSDTVNINGLSSNPENIVWTQVEPGVFVGDADNGQSVTISGAEYYVIGADTVTTLACFAEGTRIATAKGEMAVEDLRVGDLLVATDGGAPLQPAVWLGHTRINVARHPNRAAVAPVLIKAGALAEGAPHRDLRVSPDHAMFLDGALVPAKHLVNGTTIVQEVWCPEVTYWHVELPAHGLLVSEGAVSESYLDDGNRKHFDNFGITTLFKDFESERSNGRYAAQACRPVVEGGAALTRIHARIAARAAAITTKKRRIA